MTTQMNPTDAREPVFKVELCPWCGKAPTSYKKGYLWWIKCCKMNGTKVQFYGQTIGAAVDVWNNYTARFTGERARK